MPRAVVRAAKRQKAGRAEHTARQLGYLKLRENPVPGLKRTFGMNAFGGSVLEVAL